MPDFTDLEKRILDRLDKLQDAISGDDGLCDRMVRVETNLNNHLETQRNRFNKTTVILSIVITAVAVGLGIVGLQ